VSRKAFWRAYNRGIPRFAMRIEAAIGEIHENGAIRSDIRGGVLP
jgi:hypothetical protein